MPENSSPSDVENLPLSDVSVNHGTQISQGMRQSKRLTDPSNMSTVEPKCRVPTLTGNELGATPIITNRQGSTDNGMISHTLHVMRGEDVAQKIMELAHSGTHIVCILSATGAIGSVKLSLAATPSATTTYEGRFNIVSMSGSFAPAQGNESRIGGISVILRGQQETLFGGRVCGGMIAATTIQVEAVSFAANEQSESDLKNHVDDIYNKAREKESS